MNPIVSNGNTLKWKFENVEALNEEGVYSDKFTFQNIDWKIKIRTTTEDNVKYLSIFLYYDCENKNVRNWICEFNKTIKLLNQNENGKDSSSTWSDCYNAKSQTWGWPCFQQWSELKSEGYMKDDSIIVQIDLSFKYYDFSKNFPNYTDIIIELEDTKFFLNKGALSSKSEYFFNLFFIKKARENIIKLENVEAQDFCYLLASCCMFFETVQEANYENLIKLATDYGVPVLHRNCEKFLISEADLQIVEKLRYADAHNYNELMKTCLDSLETTHQIKLLQKSVEFDNFKESTKIVILTRLYDLV